MVICIAEYSTTNNILVLVNCFRVFLSSACGRACNHQVFFWCGGNLMLKSLERHTSSQACSYNSIPIWISSPGTVPRISGVRGCCPILITGSFVTGPRLGVCSLQIPSVWTYTPLLGSCISIIVLYSCPYSDPTLILPRQLTTFLCGVQSWILSLDQRHKPLTALPLPVTPQ